jgi:hypothetical protein
MDSTHTQDSERNNSDRQGKIFWHEAFFEALQLELHDYLEVLTFVDEYQLSKEALIMDVLIIKKEADVYIGKNIGEVFRSHNIFEFKSETDSLSVWDYNKVLGYAMIYSAFERVPLTDITVSFVVTPKPTSVFKELAKVRGLVVDETHRGIYYVSGEPFPVQIIESKRLAAKENVFLKHLRSNLTPKDMRDVIGAYRKYGLPEKVDAYLNRLFSANTEVAKEVVKMIEMSDEVREIYRNYMVSSGMLEEEKRKSALKMISRGYALDEAADILDVPLEWMQELANKTLVPV